MSEPRVERGADAQARAASRAMLWVVFLLLFAFSYSEEVVGLVYDLLHNDAHDNWRRSFVWRMAVVGVEIAALIAVAYKKRTISRADDGPPRLWGVWWGGFALAVVLDAVLSELPFRPSVWVLLVAAAIFAATMYVLMTSALNADPRTLFSVARREAHPTDWRRVRAVVPLVVGTFASFLAALAYRRSLDIDTVRVLPTDMVEQVAALSLPERITVLETVCEGAISPIYYQHVVAVIPLLLLTLGVEFNYFRKNLAGPAHRATTAATVVVMSAALVVALSTLPLDGVGCGDILPAWHELLASNFRETRCVKCVDRRKCLSCTA